MGRCRRGVSSTMQQGSIGTQTGENLSRVEINIKYPILTYSLPDVVCIGVRVRGYHDTCPLTKYTDKTHVDGAQIGGGEGCLV